MDSEKNIDLLKALLDVSLIHNYAGRKDEFYQRVNNAVNSLMQEFKNADNEKDKIFEAILLNYISIKIMEDQSLDPFLKNSINKVSNEELDFLVEKLRNKKH